jgi:membrane-associated phospholipid phosphatase
MASLHRIGEPELCGVEVVIARCRRAERVRAAWSAVWVAGVIASRIAPLDAQMYAQSGDSSASIQASVVDSSTQPASAHLASAPHVIRWYEAAAALAGVAALSLLDEPIQRYSQRHRSPTSDDLASVFDRMGQPEVYATVSLGVLAAGIAANDRELAQSGGRLVASVGLAGATTLVLKRVTGRASPGAGLGAYHFDAFSGADALPSGHTALAFALATSLSDDIHTTWVSVLLYTAATGTALARVNDDEHWMSDNALGALVGITSAKLVSGRWQVFGIRPPQFLMSPAGTEAIGWSIRF